MDFLVYIFMNFNICVINNKVRMQNYSIIHPNYLYNTLLWSIIHSNHWAILHHHGFVFLWMSYWNCTAGSLLRLASFTQDNVWRLIQVVTYINSSFHLFAKKSSIVWIYHSLFVYSPLERHLGNFQCIFYSYERVSTNICVQVFVWLYVHFSRVNTQKWDFWVIQ